MAFKPNGLQCSCSYVLVSTCITSPITPLLPRQGSLGFLTLFSPSTLSPSDDGFSPAINVGSDGFRFGPDTVTGVYVSSIQ